MSQIEPEALAERLLAQEPAERDIAIVQEQLGRYPRGMVAVGARCVRAPARRGDQAAAAWGSAVPHHVLSDQSRGRQGRLACGGGGLHARLW